MSRPTGDFFEEMSKLDGLIWSITKGGQECWASNEYFVKKIDRTPRQIQRYLNFLKDIGRYTIKVSRVPIDGAWKSHRVIKRTDKPVDLEKFRPKRKRKIMPPFRLLKVAWARVIYNHRHDFLYEDGELADFPSEFNSKRELRQWPNRCDDEGRELGNGWAKPAYVFEDRTGKIIACVDRQPLDLSYFDEQIVEYNRIKTEQEAQKQELSEAQKWGLYLDARWFEGQGDSLKEAKRFEGLQILHPHLVKEE